MVCTALLWAQESPQDILSLIRKANDYWQQQNPPQKRAFWDHAAYHTGNMEVYRLTGEQRYLDYSSAWAEHNQWKGATSDNRTEWKYGYGETPEYVLFGDWQCCFQTYADLYDILPVEQRIARAREVMEYQMSTDFNGYWWWADGLYMVMPVMTKLYKLTNNKRYLEKLHEYFLYADSVMYDPTEGLYYRDRNFVYPKHQILDGKKDFWARGDGWVLAALAKVLQDLPDGHEHTPLYTSRFLSIAKALIACQHPDGYWTRSLLEHDYAPGPETSGTAFFAYGLQWGINHGLLDAATYQPVVDRAWRYLKDVALQPDGRVGYVQPIGSKAIPGQELDERSTANFGVGAFLLAACERYRHLLARDTYSGYEVTPEGAWCWFADPRALHHKSPDGTVDKTYLGYIDIHGNIKAMQLDHKTKRSEEVLIRSCFQPDDHDNPTFLVLPDQRVMVFYSRHTDERRFYYRVSRLPGNITTLGEEKIIPTKNNTTYPSPFILTDDPEHIYLCWRGINWHPTIARLTLPDKHDDVRFDWGPYQIVQSTGARPYAKYTGNGKDRIYVAYTTGHPDNEQPNYVYVNYIDIHTRQLKDVKGRVLSTIAEGPHQINKEPEYVRAYPDAVAVSTPYRNWLWEAALDEAGRPVVAMVRISPDKMDHDYYYLRWTGDAWQAIFLDHAGGHFHQTPDTERCYSGGMTLDKACPGRLVCSVPHEGAYGRVFELVEYQVDDAGNVTKRPITRNSPKNNVRPYLLPGTEEGDSARLGWMQGDYYDWIVSKRHPKGYCTGIRYDFAGYPRETVGQLRRADRNYQFNRDENFVFADSVKVVKGTLLKLGKLSYEMSPKTLKAAVKIGRKTYTGTNSLGNSDCWKDEERGTNGKWYTPCLPDRIHLRLTYTGGVLTTYVNGLMDQRIFLKE